MMTMAAEHNGNIAGGHLPARLSAMTRAADQSGIGNWQKRMMAGEHAHGREGWPFQHGRKDDRINRALCPIGTRLPRAGGIEALYVGFIQDQRFTPVSDGVQKSRRRRQKPHERIEDRIVVIAWYRETWRSKAGKPTLRFGKFRAAAALRDVSRDDDGSGPLGLNDARRPVQNVRIIGAKVKI